VKGVVACSTGKAIRVPALEALGFLESADITDRASELLRDLSAREAAFL
jgi:hypothetical protein